ncbi:hypothetical protein SKAU_G00182440 [Synaphobranchus kaupii]|uniref:Uncharacterized protein n=1 Tax=Synaphobranchus kaupii TaxID=118154 RepID=A0A9Q1IWL5_SYNKA|nr:hypothetical protein SKAU_G00182440 [Synaphobranchus kaupii]
MGNRSRLGFTSRVLFAGHQQLFLSLSVTVAIRSACPGVCLVLFGVSFAGIRFGCRFKCRAPGGPWLAVIPPVLSPAF